MMAYSEIEFVEVGIQELAVLSLMYSKSWIQHWSMREAVGHSPLTIMAADPDQEGMLRDLYGPYLEDSTEPHMFFLDVDGFIADGIIWYHGLN